MRYEACFPHDAPDPAALSSLGFRLADGVPTCETDAKTQGFRFRYRIMGRACDVAVYDLDSGWEYDLFNVPSSSGATVTALREEAEAFMRAVARECFGVRRFREAVLDYCRATYGTEPDCPFEGDEAQALRKPSGKWYGLMMNIPADRLDKRRKGNVDVLNLKALPERIAAADGVSVFPAWHMNKKYWLTVLLDSAIAPDLLHALIDESYRLVK